MPGVEEDEAQVGAQDDQGALAHVDDPHHAEDQGQARRHQGIDSTGQHAQDRGLEELASHASPF